MANRHKMVSNSTGGGGGGSSGRSRRDEEFEEEEVWGFMTQREDSNPNWRISSKEYSSTGSASAWRFSSGSRVIPRGKNPSHETETKVVQRASAPVNIPDWSKIYGTVSKKSSNENLWVDNEDGKGDNFLINSHHGDNYGNGGTDNGGGGDDDDDDDDDDEMVPPHEWVARKLARTQISSFSVCEGIGRTLKGRDLSKVRNAILTKTGFLE